MELLNGFDEIVVGLCENELLFRGTVDENSVDTGCTHIACRVELSIYTCRENGVHKQVLKSIDIGITTVSETFVNSPYLDAFGNLLVCSQ